MLLAFGLGALSALPARMRLPSRVVWRSQSTKFAKIARDDRNHRSYAEALTPQPPLPPPQERGLGGEGQPTA